MRGLTTRQKALRNRFESHACRKGADEYFLTLTSVDIRELSVPQIFELLHFTCAESFVDYPIEQQNALTLELENGALANPDLRKWYDAELTKVKHTAEAHIGGVWNGRSKSFNKRIEEAYDKVREIKDFENFFMMRDMLDNFVGDRLAKAGLRDMHLWRDSRFKKSIFPHPKSLSGMFRICGKANPSLKLFHGKVKEAYTYLPMYVRDFLQTSGYVFRVAERLSHIEENYAQRKKLNIDNASYEERACGVHVGGKRHIDIPQYIVPKTDTGKSVAYIAHDTFEDLGITEGHEAGHAIVAALDDITTFDEDIKNAYETDLLNLVVNGMDDEFISRYAHYLPETHGGRHEEEAAAREEAMVEIMGELMVREFEHDSDKSMFTGELYVHMHHMLKQALQLLETMRAEYAVNKGGADFPDTQALDKFTRREFSMKACHTTYMLGY